MKLGKMKKSEGFTLIELLIVISIIGVLSAFFINSSSINIRRGRDARRKSDLELIRTGIETYRADCNSYPLTGQISPGGTLKGNGATIDCPAANTYITLVPKDPVASDNYVYTSNGITYQICSTLEAAPAGTSPATCNGSPTSCGGTCYYPVVNP